jgi:RNA polymerase sigma factor (sigma-70 family)
MHDERDAEDVRLLADGSHAELLAAYHDVVVGRCVAALRWPRGYDAAQDVFVRLLAELRKGKTYSVPYRVVVHKVIDWTVKQHLKGEPVGPLPDDWEPTAPDELDEALGNYDLMKVFDDLPEGQRNVCRLRYLIGLGIDQIAERLGMQENAVHQALWRGHQKLRETFASG